MKDAATQIALVMGDPTGVGTELMAALLARQDVSQRAAVIAIGDRRVLAEGERISGVRLNLPVYNDPLEARYSPGSPAFIDLRHLDPRSIPQREASKQGGAFSMRNFAAALDLAKDGHVDGIVFLPFNKLALKMAGSGYLDEAYWAASYLGHKGPCSIYGRFDNLWSARVTSHVSLAQVPALITRERVLLSITEAARVVNTAGTRNPRIAVAALNPHGGDGGVLGTEEIEIIAPAISDAQRQGVNVAGPFPSDTIWHAALRGEYDVVLCMYHDQSQIAAKLIAFERGVGVMLGLPVPICSTGHGTAYDIAGKGTAKSSSSVQAFEVCLALATAQKQTPSELVH